MTKYKNDCEGCESSLVPGVRANIDYGGRIVNNPGDGLPVERCDTCERYDDDNAAQIAFFRYLVAKHDLEDLPYKQTTEVDLSYAITSLEKPIFVELSKLLELQGVTLKKKKKV